MKKLFAIATISLAALGCADKKKQAQAILDSVGAVHEKLMGLDDQLEKSKSELDTLVKQLQAGPQLDSAKMYRGKVDLADSVMMTWMHGFSPDSAFKSDDEKITYLRNENTLLMHIDSQMNDAAKTAGAFLSKNKKK